MSTDQALVWVDAPGATGARIRLTGGGRTLRYDRPGPSAGRSTVQWTFDGLTPGARYQLQVRLTDAAGVKCGEATGTFRAAADRPEDVSFLWSGDVVGQGFGIDPTRGGLFAFKTMVREQPEFFIFSGDTVYADQPLVTELKLPDGSAWKNRVTPEKSQVAETLEAFRGQYRYNWLDEHYAAFFRQVPVIAQWDDHETRNNWYPGRRLADDDRYTVADCTVLAARARQAFGEAFPRSLGAQSTIFRRIPRGPLLDVFVLDARSFRSSNVVASRGPHRFFGPAQADWLVESLARSRALWKVVACDQPLGLVIGDGPGAIEGLADGTAGPPRFREVELARLLDRLAKASVENLVFLTADVHYAAAHRYERPLSFWEFVAGPLHAGQFGPAELDPTFRTEVVYRNREPGQPQNVPPSATSTSYGRVTIDRKSRALTVELKDGAGRLLHRQRLAAAER